MNLEKFKAGEEFRIKELLYPAFNSIREIESEDKLGWDAEQFTTEELNTTVTIEGFMADLDGYLCVLISGLESSKFLREELEKINNK